MSWEKYQPTALNWESYRPTLVQIVHDNLNAAQVATVFDGYFYSIRGMSGKRFRYFLNHLIRAFDYQPSYLEVGLWHGSTLFSAVSGNNVRAIGIDNWVGIPASVNVEGESVEAPRAAFKKHLDNTQLLAGSVEVIERDFHTVDYSEIGPFDAYFYDAGHTAQDQYDGLNLALPGMADTFVYMVDDWNWPAVREGTQEAIKDAGLKVLYSKEIRTGDDSTTTTPAVHANPWFNGYFISVLEKAPAGNGIGIPPQR